MSWQSIIDRITDLPKPSPKIEDCSIITVGNVENIDPGMCYLSRVEEGTGDGLSPEGIKVQPIQGGVWIDYYRRYRDVVERRMNILLINRIKKRIFIIDSSNPLSPLILSSRHASRENSIAILIIPPREATVFEKSSSYASYEIARRKGIPAILIDRGRVGYFYGFSGDKILRHRALEGKITGMIIESLDKISSFVRTGERIGVRSYLISSVIGAGLEVYGNPHNALRALEKCVMWTLRDQETLYRSRSLLLIAKAPKPLFDKISESYVKYLEGFPELLTHDIIYTEYSSRLGLFDIAMLFGYPMIDLPDHIVQAHRSLESINPEISVEEVLE